MKLLSREVFWFRNAEYEKKLREATPDELWDRELCKFRTACGSATAIACGTVLMIPTLGLALGGVVWSGRTLDLAVTKRKMVKAEIERRNLPHYETTKRDIAIPVTLALAIFSTVGIIDILCFTGTSSAVANDASNSVAGAVQAMFSQPGEFFAGSLQGVELQAQQFYNLSGSGMLVIGSESMPVQLDSNGQFSDQGTAHLGSGSPGQGDFVPVGTGPTAAMAAASHGVAEVVASQQPGGQAELLLATNNFINEAGATGENQAQIAGISTGMMISSWAQKLGLSVLLGNSGIDKVAKGIDTSAGPPSHKTDAHNEKPNFFKKTTNLFKKTDGEPVANVPHQVLTGEKDLMFMFVSQKKTPISQFIKTLSPSKSCCPEQRKQEDRSCRFCERPINEGKQAYYHCCQCSTGTSKTASFDICEPCVATLGCSCTKTRDHVLYRRGLLSAKVQFRQE